MDDSDVLLLDAAAAPTRLAILRELSPETSVCA
jgi:DNA-binding transcriptional ArsR family regulator